MKPIQKLRSLVCALALAVAAMSSSNAATIVVDDSTHWLNNGSSNVGYTIDLINFNVGSTSQVTIDLLSVGVFSPGMDTQIYLAEDDGDIQPVDVMWVNDDGDLGADGSVFELDSYLDLELEAGTYMLYVGACCYSTAEALAGWRLVSGSDSLSSLTKNGVSGVYRATISGDVSLNFVSEGPVVPVPATAWLFASSLGALVTLRRRRQAH